MDLQGEICGLMAKSKDIRHVPAEAESAFLGVITFLSVISILLACLVSSDSFSDVLAKAGPVTAIQYLAADP